MSSDPEVVAAALGEALQGAYDRIEAERLRAVLSLWMGRRELVDATLGEFLAAVRQYQASADALAREYVELHLPRRYADGAKAATGDGVFSWTQAHVEALTALAGDSYADFLARSQEAGRTSEAFARAVRSAARRELPQVAAGNLTARGGAAAFTRRLVDEYGITVVTYRDGSRVSVRAYTEMAARTKSGVAYNAGTLNRVMEEGVRYVEVFDGAACGWAAHHDTDLAAGSIRTVAEAADRPLSHPNCRRSFGPRPDVRSDRDAARAQPTRPPAADRDPVVAEEAGWRDRSKDRAAKDQAIQEKRRRRQAPEPEADVLARLRAYAEASGWAFDGQQPATLAEAIEVLRRELTEPSPRGMV